MRTGRLLLGTRRYSSWSLRGWLVVRLAGLEVEEQVVALSQGPTAAIAQLSPSGLVPYLDHDGNQIWDSLAIGEYCAELAPGLWPAARPARTRARVLSAEMHAGFGALRTAMPMNLGRDRALAGGIAGAVRADIDRIERLWTETRNGYGAGGPYLFGADLTIADAMFAPVMARLLSYRVELEPVAAAYRDALRAHPLLQRWYADAAVEPAAWRLDRYENIP